MMQDGWQIFEGEHEAADVAALLDHHFSDMRAGSPPSACHVLEREGLRDPSISLLSLRDGDGILLGLGALKLREHGEGEIKSMRTAPAALGKGVGRFLLDALVQRARDQGLDMLRLETGNTAAFDAANHLYLSYGFTPCGPFADYAPTDFTLFYELKL